MSSIIYPKYKLPNDLNVNTVTASTGFSGNLYGTASYASDSDKLDGYHASRFATTGSNVFTNNQTITGSLYVQNAISASSITGSFSGSGAGLSDVVRLNVANTFTANQTITGSLYVSSNVSASQITASSEFIGYIDFDTSSIEPPFRTGRVHYLSANGDLQYDTDVSPVTLNIGQQTIQRCKNESGGGIGKGKLVHITGSTGTDTPRVTIADWTNDDLSANTIGMTMNSSSHMGDVFVIIGGILTGVDLSTLSGLENGQVLYLSSSGDVTNIKPVAPKHSVSIGQVIAKASPGSNSSVFVKIQNGYELSELHDVLTNGKLNGDLLSWDSSTPAWKNTQQLSGSYTFASNQTIIASSSQPALRVIQNGAGPTVFIQDGDSPENSGFLIDEKGWVGIGYSSSSVLSTNPLNVAGGGWFGGNITANGATIYNTTTVSRLTASVGISSSVHISNEITTKDLFLNTPQTKVSNSSGLTGQICWDSGWIYVCVGSNTWKSSSLN